MTTIVTPLLLVALMSIDGCHQFSTLSTLPVSHLIIINMLFTLLQTNIVVENQPFVEYVQRETIVFHIYVSLP